MGLVTFSRVFWKFEVASGFRNVGKVSALKKHLSDERFPRVFQRLPCQHRFAFSVELPKFIRISL